MKHIQSRSNPLFKRLKALSASPAEQRQQGATLIDGPHLLSAWLDRGINPLSVWVSESGLQKAEITDLIARVPETSLIACSDVLFRELTGLPSPVGIAAEVSLIRPASDRPAINEDWLVLDGVQDAGNMGTLLRSAAAFGITQVLAGRGCAGVWTPKVLRAAQGAHLNLSLYDACDLEAVLAHFKGKILVTALDAKETVYDVEFDGPVAWVMGSEGQGVSAGVAALANAKVIIPMAPGIESLNVAIAAGICMAETYRRKQVKPRG